MLVVDPGEPQHHVRARAEAHHDSSHGPHPLPATPAHPPPLDMEAAPDNATAALLPDAPADQALSNGGPAPPLSFSQPADVSGFAMAAPDFAPMDLPPPSQRPSPPLAPTDFETLTAFAKLRFDDGSYYMHTYQIILGRNIDLARRDMRRIARVDQLHADGQQQAAEELLNGHASKKRKRRPARSVISEKGGIVTAPINQMPLEYQRRQSNASQSISSASHAAADSAEDKPVQRAPQAVLMQAFPEVPPQFDGHVTENPHDCPLVPIHPHHVTARTGSHGPKGISRQHAKIFFDFDHGHFAIQVLGSNGLHHENAFKEQGAIVPLDHGDHLVIGAVNIEFYLPDVALTEDQRLRQDSGSRPMSFSFENGNGELESDDHMDSGSEGQYSINPKHMFHHPMANDYDSDDPLEEDEDDMDDYLEPLPRSQPRPAPKLKIKIRDPAAQSKQTKKANKRKHRDLSPDDVPLKKHKKHREHREHKESNRELVKEVKIAKEPKLSKELKEKEPKEPKELKEPKEKGKAPTKVASKAPIKVEEPMVPVPRETPIQEKPEPTKPVPNDSPPLLRKPFEGELEAGGEIEGLITEEMARHHNLPASLIGQVVEKRKGPGRPPKDGIMSKRQRSQLVKQAREIERAKAAGLDPADIPMPSMKPKITKRTDSNAGEGEEGDVRDSTENGDGTLLGDRKQLKPSKPARTPSPEPRVEDYTEEQLQRPTANYVVLIHEAISSSSTGQMNLQQIYNYIERKYPWYKFKTTTSGWQSSVRHNLGQHDAFVKGDKEGKGFNWKVNQEVSIEKERRKRQVSPPVSHAQRPPYYPPTHNAYPTYSQPSYPYHPGMPPHTSMPPAAPRLPPSLANSQPRLPPSMAREASTTTPAIVQNAPRPSPYASPWAGGNTAGSPPAQNSPTPYAQPNSQTPPVSSASAASAQYGVLYPTSASQSYSGPPATASPHGGPYPTAGPSPYGPGPSRPYAPYPPQGQVTVGAPSYQPPLHAQPQTAHTSETDTAGRYLASTHPDLIRQLEAFREVYLKARTEPGEDRKVDNAIRAYVDSQYPRDQLTSPEKALFQAISNIEHLGKYMGSEPAVQQAPAPVNVLPGKSTTSAGTAAAIAADAAANTTLPTAVAQESQTPTEGTSQSTNEPQKFTPNMMSASPAPHPTDAPAPPIPSLPPSHRPSVEPLTPVPGSPALQNGTPLRRSVVEILASTADASGGADQAARLESDDAGSELKPVQADHDSAGERTREPAQVNDVQARTE
ncbi:hypothetical protein BDU57DRAFT_493662 [Ampelomyces quisqualis]|uniref:Fork-head domain-containing protein n=1 Tax=Ampelomyces quisqualis TaxID=50730 RepID=A0A6A5QSG8_AMPQU|nr:hypothetical protein BDU57DRAFT_493662 [Ampelomyces quisqualis]